MENTADPENPVVAGGQPGGSISFAGVTEPVAVQIATHLASATLEDHKSRTLLAKTAAKIKTILPDTALFLQNEAEMANYFRKRRKLLLEDYERAILDATPLPRTDPQFNSAENTQKRSKRARLLRTMTEAWRRLRRYLHEAYGIANETTTHQLEAQEAEDEDEDEEESLGEDEHNLIETIDLTQPNIIDIMSQEAPVFHVPLPWVDVFLCY